MMSIVRRSLVPAVRQRVDRARESMRDPQLQTAVATVIACLELLAILLWIETTAATTSFAWSILSYIFLFILMISPLWPSSIVQRRSKEIRAEHIKIAYCVFGIPVFLAYLFFML